MVSKTRTISRGGRKKTVRVRTKIHFYKPKTLAQMRKPMYKAKASVQARMSGKKSGKGADRPAVRYTAVVLPRRLRPALHVRLSSSGAVRPSFPSLSLLS